MMGDYRSKLAAVAGETAGAPARSGLDAIPRIGQPADTAAMTGKIRRPAAARLRTGGPSLPVPVRVQKPASRSWPQPRAAAFVTVPVA